MDDFEVIKLKDLTTALDDLVKKNGNKYEMRRYMQLIDIVEGLIDENKFLTEQAGYGESEIVEGMH